MFIGIILIILISALQCTVRAKKNASYGNWTHDPRITSAMPYHLAKQAEQRFLGEFSCTYCNISNLYA